MPIFKRIAAPLVLVTALACAGPVLAAPTVDQVYKAANSGHLDEAQQLMNQVLREHPESAKAHYVEAEISARAANFPRAREELAKAQQLDPSGSFAKPEALAALQRELAHRTSSGPVRSAPRAAEAQRSSFGGWPVILLLVAGVVIVWALMSRRRPPQQNYGGYPTGAPPNGPLGGGYSNPPPGYGPAGYGPPMGGGGLGSGIAGGLASGLAIGAGVAAGESLVHHWIDKDGNRVEGPPPPGYVPPPDDNANMGGNDFGVSDSNSWDDGGSSFGGDSGGGGGGDDWT
jgi:hypothetical protein